MSCKYLVLLNFVNKNDLKVNVDERLGERIHGNLDNINIEEFEINQLLYEDYKLNNGESRSEVTKRMLDSLYEILEENNNKNIFICSKLHNFIPVQMGKYSCTPCISWWIFNVGKKLDIHRLDTSKMIRKHHRRK